jgi:hypothetical protein
VGPEILLVARGVLGGLELLLGLGDVVARIHSARDAKLELIRIAVLEMNAVEQARWRGTSLFNEESSASGMSSNPHPPRWRRGADGVGGRWWGNDRAGDIAERRSCHLAHGREAAKQQISVQVSIRKKCLNANMMMTMTMMVIFGNFRR